MKDKWTMYFEIYQSPRAGALSGIMAGASALAPRQWRWRLRAGNNQIIASGEGYNNRADCQHAVDLLKQTTVVTPVHALAI
jgi:uncharacterized protein YegP (UPF0339 family)